MSAFVDVQDSAETIINAWGGLPVNFDNTDFNSLGHDEWVRITILDGDSMQECIGATRTKRTGLIALQIFTDINGGARPARAYADTISALFNNVVDGDVIYRTPYGQRVGHQDGYFQFNLYVPFEITEA